MRPLKRLARFGLVVPDRREDRQHVGGGDLVDRLRADRRGVVLQRHHPLRVMLRVLPAALVQPDMLVGAFAEGRRAALHRLHGLRLRPVADRVDTGGHVGHPPLVADARLIER